LIQQDIRNNSTWNQRWFVSHRGRSGNNPLSRDDARREADFAIDEGATLDPYNESPWRYLIGILREQQQQQDSYQGLLVEYEVRANALRSVLTKAHRDPDTCVNMTSARVDLLEMIGTNDSLQTAIVLAEGLAKKHDVVRTKYWSLVLRRLRKKEREKSLADT
jgi:protein farnesyltransferase/geranylgeranyltransferase type-1 subunit alpha